MNHNNNRIIYFDFLRIVALFAVIWVHSEVQSFGLTEVGSFQWIVIDFFSSTGRFSIPVFVMISGALFLGRDIPIGVIYRKNILRIVTAFVFWALFYALWIYKQTGSVSHALPYLYNVFYHMWFLYMIVGLYVLIPVLRRITADKNILRYFLYLSLVIVYIIPRFIAWISVFNTDLGDKTAQVWNYFDLSSISCYVFIFVLGYYIANTDIPKHIRYISYACALLCFAGAFFTSWYLGVAGFESYSLPYASCSLGVLMEAVGVFMAARYGFMNKKISPKMERFLGNMSKYNFGAYLTHAFVLDFINKYLGFTVLSINPILADIVLTCIVFTVSFVISAIINRIPVLGKYIV